MSTYAQQVLVMEVFFVVVALGYITAGIVALFGRFERASMFAKATTAVLFAWLGATMLYGFANYAIAPYAEWPGTWLIMPPEPVDGIQRTRGMGLFFFGIWGLSSAFLALHLVDRTIQAARDARRVAEDYARVR